MTRKNRLRSEKQLSPITGLKNMNLRPFAWLCFYNYWEMRLRHQNHSGNSIIQRYPHSESISQTVQPLLRTSYNFVVGKRDKRFGLKFIEFETISIAPLKCIDSQARQLVGGRCFISQQFEYDPLTDNGGVLIRPRVLTQWFIRIQDISGLKIVEFEANSISKLEWSSVGPD